MRYIFIFFLLSTCSSQEECKFYNSDSYSYSNHRFEPEKGLITAPATAAGIAESVAKEVYGDAEIERQKPFIVSIKEDDWQVRGSMKKPVRGGVFEMEISKIDGRVLRVSHGK